MPSQPVVFFVNGRVSYRSIERIQSFSAILFNISHPARSRTMAAGATSKQGNGWPCFVLLLSRWTNRSYLPVIWSIIVYVTSIQASLRPTLDRVHRWRFRTSITLAMTSIAQPARSVFRVEMSNHRRCGPTNKWRYNSWGFIAGNKPRGSAGADKFNSLSQMLPRACLWSTTSDILQRSQFFCALQLPTVAKSVQRNHLLTVTLPSVIRESPASQSHLNA